MRGEPQAGSSHSLRAAIVPWVAILFTVQLVSGVEDKLRIDVACKVNNMANGNTKPLKKIKVGAIDAAVWKNVIKNQKTGADVTIYSATMERRYKDQAGDWKGTNSFHGNDIPKAILALQKAYEYVVMEAGQDDDAVTEAAEDGSAPK